MKLPAVPALTRTTRASRAPAMSLALAAIAALFALVTPAAALEVKVDPRNGAPCLTVNGKPVPARMFWGAPGSAPLKAGPAPAVIAFEFTPDQSSNTGTLHFRFGETPGDIFLDDIRITDLDSGRDILPAFDFESGPAAFAARWRTWPPGEKNTVGAVAIEKSAGAEGSSGLHVALKSPPAGPGGAKGGWPDFHIHSAADLKLEKGHRCRVSFWARAQPARDLRVAVYRPGDPYERLGGPGDVFAPQIRLAARAGVDFVSFPVGLPWPEPGKPADFTGVETACQRVLDANPNALLVPRIGMNPPAWWHEAHPGEMMAWEDGSRKRPYAVPGEIYVRDACERLGILVRHLEARFSERIAGYHPCGQNTGEWFYQDTWGRLLSGYAPADQREWRTWLRARYGSDAALRKAWSRAHGRIDEAEVPSAASRHAAPSGALRDPATQQEFIDFAQFQQELMADCVTSLAKTVRQASAGRKLVVFFYGYVFEFGAIANGAPVAGHYALRRALDSPDIDVLCSPISYFDRALGESGPAMTAAESVALAGKLWLAEDDTSTYLSTGTPPGHKERVSTLEETNHLLARNVAQESLRNLGTWWMDLGAAGWFNDPGMWQLFERLGPMDRAMIDKPAKFAPEVAAIIDEASMLHVAPGGTSVTLPGIYEVRRPLGRMGAPYGQYLLDDLVAGKVKAKLYVILNAWRLDARQRAAIRENTRGAVVIWCFAPGCFDEGQRSPQAMRELTGFDLRPVDGAKARAQPTEAGKSLGLTAPMGRDAALTPLFAAADAKPEETLAAYSNGAAAVAMRKVGPTTSIFAGAPGLTSELLRAVARRAGVHLFTDVDANVYANGGFIAIHAAADGPVAIDTGHPGEIRELLSARALGAGPRLTIPMKRGQTIVLDCR